MDGKLSLRGLRNKDNITLTSIQKGDIEVISILES